MDAAVFYTQAAKTIEARMTADAQSAFEKQTQVAQTAAVQMEMAVQTVTARTTQQGTRELPSGSPQLLFPSPSRAAQQAHPPAIGKL